MTWKKFFLNTFWLLVGLGLVALIAALAANNTQPVIADDETSLVPVTGHTSAPVMHIASPKMRAMRGAVITLQNAFNGLWSRLPLDR
jgi:hypothetical protein